MATDSLLGTWKLTEWARIAADGTITHPFTPEATGRLIYAANGLMSAFLMMPDWSAAAERAGTRGLTAYSARWELMGDIVHHAVDFASDPRMLGETLRRRVVPTPEGITLETLSAVGRADRESIHRLSWAREA
jgi:hypothetical protein